MAASRNRRPGFSRRAQYGLFLGYVVAVAGALVAAALLVLDRFDPPALAVLRGGAREVTAPISTTLATAGRGFAGVPAAIGGYFRVHDENVRLRAELKTAAALLTRARALNYDNRRLRALLRVREGAVDTVAVARLVSSTPSSTRRFATLNAGSRQGVRAGQPVQAADGLVGQVTEVSPDTAHVLLLTDPESAIPVRRARDGFPAIAAGRGDGLVDIRAVSTAATPFAAGDVFVTSGTGGIFAPGVPVARIVGRSREAGLAQPFASPDTLDFALVQRSFVEPPAAPAAPVKRPLP